MPKNQSAFGEVVISPLSGAFDLRSPSGRLDPSDFRVVLNASMNELGKRCRRPGFKKLFADAEVGFNNQDLHDQLLDLQLYYDYEDFTYTFPGYQTGTSYGDVAQGVYIDGYRAGWVGNDIYYCDDVYCCACPAAPSIEVTDGCGFITIHIDTSAMPGYPYSLNRNGVEIASGTTGTSLDVSDAPPSLHITYTYTLEIDLGWPCGVLSSTASGRACEDVGMVSIETDDSSVLPGDVFHISHSSSGLCGDYADIYIDGALVATVAANTSDGFDYSLSEPGDHEFCIVATDACGDYMACVTVTVEHLCFVDVAEAREFCSTIPAVKVTLTGPSWAGFPPATVSRNPSPNDYSYLYISGGTQFTVSAQLCPEHAWRVLESDPITGNIHYEGYKDGDSPYGSYTQTSGFSSTVCVVSPP